MSIKKHKRDGHHEEEGFNSSVDSEGSNEMIDDIEFEPVESETARFGVTDTVKKLKLELKEAKRQTQEYLTGWQKERASFANYKTLEEKRRNERLTHMKQSLVMDFFPVLDSFDMAFNNKDAWEKVDQSWRTGIEYIYSQFMKTLENYGISAIDARGVEFDPLIHDPSEHVPVEDPNDDHKVLSIIQKGYQAGNAVLRPAKVTIGKYEDQ